MISTLYIIDRPGQGLAPPLLDPQHHTIESFFSAATFLELVPVSRPACILLDLQLPDSTGTQLLERIRAHSDVPVILMAEQWNTTDLMRSFALKVSDLWTKPLDLPAFRMRVRQLLDQDSQRIAFRSRVLEARRKLALLTDRQREFLNLLIRGLSQKEIAATLRISPRTIEKHRVRVSECLGTRHISDYIYLDLLARCTLPSDPPADPHAIPPHDPLLNDYGLPPDCLLS
jgi:two-component system, LuxR family, response regulator FixJ